VELRVLDVGFVTWDSETGPFLSLLDMPSTTVLLMTFVDVHGWLVSVRFDDAVAMRWQVVPEHFGGERDDRCYEVTGTKWLADHQVDTGTEHLRHLSLPFNAVGFLEVLCTAITAVKTERTSRGLDNDQTRPRWVAFREWAAAEHAKAVGATAGLND
jgi:hypothetical protein